MLADSNASAELGTSPHLTTGIDVVVEQSGADAGETYEIEIIKSVVYGGLVESITSLGVVSSAAGGGTPTCKYFISDSLCPKKLDFLIECSTYLVGLFK